MTCIELDEEVLNVAKTWFALQETENVRLVVENGLVHIQELVDQCKLSFVILISGD